VTAALGRFGFLALGSFIRKSSKATINTPIATYWFRHGSNDPGESGSSGSLFPPTHCSAAARSVWLAPSRNQYSARLQALYTLVAHAAVAIARISPQFNSSLPEKGLALALRVDAGVAQ
jgi:hypothetical protein